MLSRDPSCPTDDSRNRRARMGPPPSSALIWLPPSRVVLMVGMEMVVGGMVFDRAGDGPAMLLAMITADAPAASARWALDRKLQIPRSMRTILPATSLIRGWQPSLAGGVPSIATTRSALRS